MTATDALTTARDVAANRPSLRRRSGDTALGRKRLEYDLSLREVEKATGISNGHLSLLEHGKAEAGVKVAIVLARFYETTVEDLFGDLVIPHSPAAGCETKGDI